MFCKRGSVPLCRTVLFLELRKIIFLSRRSPVHVHVGSRRTYRCNINALLHSRGSINLSRPLKANTHLSRPAKATSHAAFRQCDCHCSAQLVGFHLRLLPVVSRRHTSATNKHFAPSSFVASMYTYHHARPPCSHCRHHSCHLCPFGLASTFPQPRSSDLLHFHCFLEGSCPIHIPANPVAQLVTR